MTLLTRKLFFLLLLLLLLVLPVALIPRIATLNPATHSKELFLKCLLGFLAVTFAWLWRGLPRRRLDLLEKAILAFVAVNFLSCVLSSRPHYCLEESWHVWVGSLLALGVYRFAPSMAELGRISAVVVFAGIVTTAYGFAVYLGWDPLRSLYPFDYNVQEGRNYIHSFLGNPEYFGSYMAPLAVICFGRFFQAKQSLVFRAGWFVTMLMFLVALILSGSRGALLGFAVALALVVTSEVPKLAPSVRKKLAIAAGVGACVLVGLFVVLSFPNPLNRRNMRLAQRFADLADINSISVRERIFFYSVAGSMIAQHPVLGAGPGSFRLDFYPAIEHLIRTDPHAGVLMMTAELHKRVAEHAHNDYLEFWVETGTLGFAALLFVLSAAFVRFALCRPQALTPAQLQLHSYRSGFFAAAACIFVNACFSFPLHLPVRASLAWTLLGCFLAADTALRTEEVPETALSPAAVPEQLQESCTGAA